MLDPNYYKEKNNNRNGKQKSKKSEGNQWWILPENAKIMCETEDEKKWFDMVPTVAPGEHRIIRESVDAIMIAVPLAFEIEVDNFHKSSAGKMDSDQKWINDVIRSGTLSDKIAALALRVQSSPVHHLESLDILVDMAHRKEQRMSQLALEALKDLLIHNLLPDRRLQAFRHQSLGNPSMNMRTAVFMWYEDQLILRMSRILDALDSGLKSTVDYYKKICMTITSDLLSAKPEQEVRLLNMLVNKLGDPVAAITTKCTELLKSTISQHHAMKGCIVKETRQLIYRPSLPARAVYAGTVFLTQIPLFSNTDDQVVAELLVECYVGLFEKAIQLNELGSRLLAALLNGINHAFPYLKDKKSLEKHTDSLFRIVHSTSFATATQALLLLSHIALGGGSEATGKKDKKGKNGQTKPNNAEEISSSDDLVNRFYKALYAKLWADEISSRSKNTLFLNMLFRSLKRDTSDKRTMAFIKRMVICASQSSPPIAAGLLFLVSEVCRHRPVLVTLFTAVPDSKDDAKDEDWNSAHMFDMYDANKRDPLFAFDTSKDATQKEEGANLPVGLWELPLLQHHFHPSVSAFCNSLLGPDSNHSINFMGDPTTEFSLGTFLNRFAYKNPKKDRNGEEGESKPKKASRSQVSEEPLNTMHFVHTSAADVAPDKAFFHKYFGARQKLLDSGKSRNRSRRQTKKRSGSDSEDSEDDGEGDDELDGDGDMNEKQIDAFADKLAKDLMRQNVSDDDASVSDDDDMSDTEDDDDDMDDDDEGSDVELQEGEFSEGDNSDVGEDFVGEPSDEELSDDEQEEPAPVLKEKPDKNKKARKIEKEAKVSKKNKRKMDSMDVFASADDYEEEMDSIVTNISKKKQK